VTYAMSDCVQVMMYMRQPMTSLYEKFSVICRACFGFGVLSISSVSFTLGYMISSNAVGCTGIVASLCWSDSRIL
jgi:hypothetical protein